jgi:hypothetical protein
MPLSGPAYHHSRVDIIWVEIDHQKARGHGVLFHHQDAPQGLVAFAIGYEWHKPGTPVTVEVLTKAPQGVSEAHWTRVLSETKSAVERYFSGRQPLDTEVDNGPVSVWYNA